MHSTFFAVYFNMSLPEKMQEFYSLFKKYVHRVV